MATLPDTSTTFAKRWATWHNSPLTDTILDAQATEEWDRVAGLMCEWYNATTGKNAIHMGKSKYTGSDDAKLLQMYNDAQTGYTQIVPMIIGQPSSFTAPITMGPGSRLFGYWGPPIGLVDPEQNARFSPYTLTVKPGGPWIKAPTSGNVFNREFSNLHITGNAATQVFQSTGNDYATRFMNVATNLVGSVWGTSTEKYIGTQYIIGGSQPHINVQHIVGYWGGSDCKYFIGDSNVGVTGTPGTNDGPICRWNATGKSYVGPMYINVIPGGWTGITVDGGQLNSMDFIGTILEGTNGTPGAQPNGKAADANLYEQNGGNVTWIGGRWGYCQGANLNGPWTSGYGNLRAGSFTSFGMKVEKTAGLSDDCPILYATGGQYHVRALQAQGSAWGSPTAPGTKANGGVAWDGVPRTL
jgi:hypothetical protein